MAAAHTQCPGRRHAAPRCPASKHKTPRPWPTRGSPGPRATALTRARTQTGTDRPRARVTGSKPGGFGAVRASGRRSRGGEHVGDEPPVRPHCGNRPRGTIPTTLRRELDGLRSESSIVRAASRAMAIAPCSAPRSPNTLVSIRAVVTGSSAATDPRTGRNSRGLAHPPAEHNQLRIENCAYGDVAVPKRDAT